MHYFKLILRACIFLAALLYYLFYRLNAQPFPIDNIHLHWLFMGIWIIYAVDMAIRIIPFELESPGCQKVFAENYHSTGLKNTNRQSWFRTFVVLVSWIVLNAIIGVLYYTNIIDDGIVFLISLAYGVCDMICILYFCPFQTWIMKNRCCTTCRIYNWDYAMMFTPFIFIPTLYTWSLLTLAILILARWEITYRFHPERFSDQSNAYLKCQNCTEKLCKHKKQLQGFLKKHKDRFQHKK